MKIFYFISLLVIFSLTSVSKENDVLVTPSESDSECCPEGRGVLPKLINDNRNNYAPYVSKGVELSPNLKGKEILWFTQGAIHRKDVDDASLNYVIRDENLSGKCANLDWKDRTSVVFVDLDEDSKDINNWTIGSISIYKSTVYFCTHEALHKNGINGSGQLLNIWVGDIIYKNGRVYISNPQEIDEINSWSDTFESWDSHPYISSNGKHLFFASDRDKNDSIKGRNPKNTNIWYSNKSSGSWSHPILVEGANTDSMDWTPALSIDEKYLYFSSSINGNFDIYAAEFISGVGSKVKTPVKIEKVLNEGSKCDGKAIQINTQANEIFPFINNNGEIYYTSDKEGGFGKYDIYSCISTGCLYYELTLLDACNNADPVKSPLTKLIDLNGNELTPVDKLGDNTYRYKLLPNMKYEAFGGSSFSVTNSDCYTSDDGILTHYSEPLLNTITEFMTDTKTSTDTLYFDEIKYNNLLKGIEGNKIYKPVITREKINGNIVDITSSRTDTFTPLNNDEWSVIRLKTEVTNWNQPTQMVLNDGCKSTGVKVSTSSVKSMKTMGKGISTFTAEKELFIKDTVYVTPQYKKPYKVQLEVAVIDACSGKIIENSMVAVKGGSLDTLVTNNKGNLTKFNLECGQEYTILGGFKKSQNTKEINDNYVLKYLSKDAKIKVDGANIESEKKTISTNEINGDTIFRDTVYIMPQPNIRYNLIVKNQLDGRHILDPELKINNEVIKSDTATRYLDYGAKVKSSGGSNYSGFDCSIFDSVVVQSYHIPVKGVEYTLESKISELELVVGANVNSDLSYTSPYNITNSDLCQNTVINDTVWLLPSYYFKPACEMKYITLEGFHKNIPYFQTGFWEVNSKENFQSHLDRLESGFTIDKSEKQVTRDKSDYTVVNESSLYPIKLDDKNKYSISNARWIELHPNNTYWGQRKDLWQGESPERFDKREERINDYKKFSERVSENLDAMAEEIAMNIIPVFNEIKSKPGNEQSKLLIEMFALSDQRDVKRGWYIGDETIKYTEGEYNERNNQINFKNININPPVVNENTKTVSAKTDLNYNNSTLSELRAWFGYNEIYKRLKKYSSFNEFPTDKVITPDNPAPSNIELNKANIIILTKGKKIDEFSKSHIDKYADKNKESSFYLYDTTRRVEIQIRVVNYSEGYLVPSDCCIEVVVNPKNKKKAVITPRINAKVEE